MGGADTAVRAGRTQQTPPAIRRTNVKRSIVGVGMVTACLLSTVSPARADEMGDKIVAFAANRVGQKVGDGHSTRLVEQAFAAADAKPGRDLRWGTTDGIGALHPGDIIQFRLKVDPKTFKTERAVFAKDGVGTWDLTGFPAIVEKAQGTRVTILYQDGNGTPVSDGARVRRLDLNLTWRKTGTYDFYRPIYAPAWAHLGEKIVAFAAARVDQKGVGDGQCTSLVEQALAAAGAKPGKDYVWGTTDGVGGLYPGDIIQFQSAVFKKDGWTWNLGAPNHTAIVEKAWGTHLTLLHQNVDGEPATEKSRVRRM
jgi:hypothetical protein